jgi:hypothetical protein
MHLRYAQLHAYANKIPNRTSGPRLHNRTEYSCIILLTYPPNVNDRSFLISYFYDFSSQTVRGFVLRKSNSHLREKEKKKKKKKKKNRHPTAHFTETDSLYYPLSLSLHMARQPNRTERGKCCPTGLLLGRGGRKTEFSSRGAIRKQFFP